MPPVRVDDEKHQSAGLHVVSIEFPPTPPRYSRIRIPTWFGGSSGRRQSNVPPVPAIPSTSRASDQQQQASASPLSGSQTAIINPVETNSSRSNDKNQEDIEKSELLDRRWLGWTWRRWAFVLGPCLAVVVMAVVLVVVFVTRSGSDSSTGTTSTGTPTASGLPSSASTGAPVPSAPILPTSSGALNGTSIASANPGNGQDALWVFYQDISGDLSYIALEESGNWGTPIKLTVPDGILNGSAITAINYPAAAPTKINLIYQNGEGNLRNFLYTNTSGKFIDGYFEKYTVPLPTNPNVVKRISWYSDDLYYHYIYFAGSDGTIREYTYNMNTNAWTPSFTFPNSNGYAGCSVLYDTNHNVTTMHLINTQNQLQFYWRNYSNVTDAAPAPAWTAGATIPGTNNTPLGFNMNPNSTVSMTQFVGEGVFVQEADTNTIWQVGRSGLRDKQTWSTGVSTNASGIKDTDMYVERVSLGTVGKQVEYAFVQQSGNDITLLSKVSGSFQKIGAVPVGTGGQV